MDIRTGAILDNLVCFQPALHDAPINQGVFADGACRSRCRNFELSMKDLTSDNRSFPDSSKRSVQVLRHFRPREESATLELYVGDC